MRNIPEVLQTLASQRPLFHSEADFQHALAWELHKQMPDVDVRLELPKVHSGKLLHVDIWMTQGRARCALELKYKTRALSMEAKGESFRLLNQSAQDLGRYDFLKDIQRLEQLCSDDVNLEGYAILLTNDSSYWKPPRDDQCVDAAFRIPEGRVIHGTLQWGNGASTGTMRDRESPLEVQGTYAIHWEDYAQPATAAYGRFRYVLVKV